MRQMKTMVIFAVLVMIGSFAFAQAEQKPAMTMPMQKDMAMAGCKAMMQRHQEMQASMKEKDDRLQQLVKDMNAARGSAKVDRMAAVVTELVNQRTQMREHMSAMMPQMMHHIVGHMQSGMMRGMSESMANCPMASQMAQGEHQHH